MPQNTHQDHLPILISTHHLIPGTEPTDKKRKLGKLYTYKKRRIHEKPSFVIQNVYIYTRS